MRHLSALIILMLLSMWNLPVAAMGDYKLLIKRSEQRLVVKKDDQVVALIPCGTGQWWQSS